MGCWTESCAVSGLPIEEDQECVSVVLDHEAYERMHESRNFNVYDLGLLYSTTPDAFRVFQGCYDDYGWIKGVSPNPTHGDEAKPFCLIRKEVWDLIQGWKKYPLDGVRWANEDVKRFLMFCSLVRVTPHMACGSSFTGHQMVEREEIEARRALLDVCEIQTNHRVRQMQKDEEDL